VVPEHIEIHAVITVHVIVTEMGFLASLLAATEGASPSRKILQKSKGRRRESIKSGNKRKL